MSKKKSKDPEYSASDYSGKEFAKMRFDGIQHIVHHGHLRWWTHSMAAVWMCLWSHENARSWRTVVGQPLIAKEVGGNSRRALAGLRRGGYLELMSGGTGRTPSVWRMTVPNLRGVDVPAMWHAATLRAMKPELVGEWLETVQPAAAIAAKYNRDSCAFVADKGAHSAHL